MWLNFKIYFTLLDRDKLVRKAVSNFNFNFLVELGIFLIF
jgi:hypothetical protein